MLIQQIDVTTGELITRDATAEEAASFSAPPSFDEQLAALDAKFEREKSGLAARKAAAELYGGAGTAAIISAIQAEYTALVVGYNAAVEALVFG